MYVNSLTTKLLENHRMLTKLGFTWPIVMVSIDSLGHAGSKVTSFAMVGQVVFPVF